MLSWTKDETLYSSYIVEKSGDNGATFQALNDAPLVHSSPNESEYEGKVAVFPDSLSANGVSFVYRVRGRSPFGVLSPPSDTVHVTGRPSPLQVLMSVKPVEESVMGQLTVTWDFPTDKEAKITGFDLYRAADTDGPYIKMNSTLLPVTQRSYTDAAPLPLNYYQIRTTDINGHPLSTFPMMGQPRDTVPPPLPVMVSGVCDISGLVTLKWQKSPAPDLQGFQVFYSNLPDNEFVVISPALLNDTLFRYRINLNTLTEDVYFSVRALDYRYNRSPMAVPIKVTRPDIVPPSAPLITAVNPTTTGVQFTWELSSSDDVVQYEFQRQKQGTPGWSNILSFTPATAVKTFTDNTANKRHWYRYRLVAIDEANNAGGSRAVQAKPINDGLRDPINGFMHIPTASMESVSLTWTYPNDIDLLGFQLYRSFDSTKMSAYRYFPVPPPNNSLEMVMTPEGNGFRYSFLDIDMDFKIPVQTNFVFFNNSNITPNKAVPNPTASANTSSFVVSNPGIPSGGLLQGTKIYYWVIAQFVDGSSSPLAGFVEVIVP